MNVFDPLRLGAVALDLLAASRATPAAIAARQAARLAQLREVALARSPLYARLHRGLARAPFAQWPVVRKPELMQAFNEWVTDPRLELAALREFVADPARVGQAYLGDYVVWESSGSSGEPGLFVQDAGAMSVYDALEALRRSSPRPLQRWLDPFHLGERIAFVGATGGHFASCVSVERLRRVNPWMARALRSFSILQPIATLVAALEAWAPSVLATYPSAAALLADEACAGRLHIAPLEVWTGGETLGAAVRRHVEASLHCSVRNNYGASEFLTIGWECGHGRLHANADWLILEPVDAAYRPVAPGQAAHTTLLTNLANTVQPLIRYDLGDQVRVLPERCACGSPLPAIEVRGRCDDALRLAGCDGANVTLLPLALATVLEDEAGLYDFQLRQLDAHTLVLRVGPNVADAAAALVRGRTALAAFARGQGVAALRIVDEIGLPVSRGRSGKAQRVLDQTGRVRASSQASAAPDTRGKSRSRTMA